MFRASNCNKDLTGIRCYQNGKYYKYYKDTELCENFDCRECFEKDNKWKSDINFKFS
ncbi:hypothetical protein PIROE2DRAFT_14448 [Piromyces sp. E2]|nr:hypothetical protein PIROE2DRAFT_14448 [Piromyces sp. E2]|eukprot:OUM59925.1 hypothetical protein PIROE2DRAFT_14448 [Piromyces sp. E2]